MNTQTLNPSYGEGRKSFYGKARTIDQGGVVELISYQTKVAELVGDDEMRIFGWFSQTTARHINSFLENNGFDRMSKKEMTASSPVIIKRTLEV